MTAPYAPTLLEPVSGEGAKVNSITFRARFNAPDSADAGNYRLMRQQLSPTTGSVEYLTDADTWTTSDTERTAIANIQDGEEVSIVVPGSWTADTVYQWRMMFDGGVGGTEAGPNSGWQVFVPRAAITMTLDVETPSDDSRPMVRWTAAGQRAYRIGVFLKAIYDDADFDWDDPAWLAQAEWLMDDFYVASNVFRQRVGTDLPSSGTYRVIGRVKDSYGVDSGWQAGPEFTQSLTPPAAPTLTLNPNVLTGVMEVTMDAAFNLADPDTAGFDSGLGLWTARDNAILEHFIGSLGGEDSLSMKATCIGATYDQMDTDHTTYDAEDTAYTDYEQQRTTQSSFPTGMRFWFVDPYTGWIPATAATDYSAIISAYPIGVGVDVELIFRWYDSGGVFLSESSMTAVNCTANSWTEVATGAVTAPASTAYLRMSVEVTCSVDDVVHFDNYAVAESAEVAWSPGGSSADLQFNLSRKIGDGDWEYVWNASRDNPTRGVSSEVLIKDRGYPIGTEETVTYRGVVVSEATGKVVASAIAESVAPSLGAQAWWMRCVDGSLPDARLRASGYSTDIGQSNKVFHTQGQEYGTVVESGDAPPQGARIRAWLYDKNEHDAMAALLASKKLLYVQRNVADGVYLRPTGRARFSQRLARGEDGNVRHFHAVDISAEIVGPPEDVIQ